MANLGANLWAQRRRQDCVYEGTCPEHGRVAVVLEGHHIDTEKAVVFITDERWQEVYRDRDSSLFVRTDAAHAAVVGSFKAGTLAPPVGCSVRTLR